MKQLAGCEEENKNMKNIDFPSAFTIAGIILSLEGAFFTVVAQIFEKTENIINRNILYPGFNGNAIKSAIEQNLKSRFGVVFIVLGSVIQIASTPISNLNSQQSCPIWAIAVVALLSPALYFTGLKPRIKSVQMKAIEKAHERGK